MHIKDYNFNFVMKTHKCKIYSCNANIFYSQRADSHSVRAVPAPGLGSRGAETGTRPGLRMLLSDVDRPVARGGSVTNIKLLNCPREASSPLTEGGSNFSSIEGYSTVIAPPYWGFINKRWAPNSG